MGKYIQFFVASIVTVAISVGVITSPVMAVGDGGAVGGVNAARGTGVPSNLANGDGSIIRRGINLMLYGIGILSVVMLIYGGFLYIVSGGQKEKVTSAKNTILYAVIGLLIAIFAYAIIHFVINIAIGGGNATDV